MSLFRRFLFRICGVVLVASGIAALFVDEQWGREGFLCLLWAVFWAVGLGLLGFRTMRVALTCDPQKMTGELFKGLVLRALVLFGSMGLVHAVAGRQWSQRALLTTTLLYLLVLGVEILTLRQALNRGELDSVVEGGRIQQTPGADRTDPRSPEGAREEASR